MDGMAVRRAPQPEPQTMHYTDLPPDTSTSPLAEEWNFYAREAAQHLQAQHLQPGGLGVALEPGTGPFSVEQRVSV